MSASDNYPLKRNQAGGYYQKAYKNANATRPGRSVIARQVGVSERLVRKVDSELLQFGSIQPPKKRAGGRRSSLAPEMKEYLLEQLELDPKVTLRVLTQNLDDRFECSVSLATISRFLARAVPKKRRKNAPRSSTATIRARATTSAPKSPPVAVPVDQAETQPANDGLQTDPPVEHTAHEGLYEVDRGYSTIPPNARNIAISYLFVHTYGAPKRSTWDGVMGEIKERLGISNETDIRNVLEDVLDCVESGKMYAGGSMQENNDASRMLGAL